jgi:hypothetical protein
MVIYQNSIACAWVIHWKRKEDITQPGLDGTRLGAHSMVDRLPTLLDRVTVIGCAPTSKHCLGNLLVTDESFSSS